MKTQTRLIIERFKNYLNSEKIAEVKKKNPEFVSALSNVTESDISFSSEPVMCFGNVFGNATAVGKKSDQYNETTRTISLDFNSDTFLFIDKSTNTTTDLVKKAQIVFPDINGYDVKYKCEAREIAEKTGKFFCKQSLGDLNFSLSEFRVNRYKLETDNDFTLPIREICAKVLYENKPRTVRIGHWWIENDEEYIYIHLDNVPLTKKEKLIIAGICALVLLVIVILLIVL